MPADEEKNLLRDKCHQRRGRWLWYRSVSWVLCWVLSRVLKFQLASWGSWFEAIQGDTAPTPTSPGKRFRCWLIKVHIIIMIVAQLIMNVKILWMEKMGRRSQPLLWDTSVLAENLFQLFSQWFIYLWLTEVNKGHQGLKILRARASWKKR